MMRLRLWEAHVDNNIAYFCLDIVQIHEYVYMHWTGGLVCAGVCVCG